MTYTFDGIFFFIYFCWYFSFLIIISIVLSLHVHHSFTYVVFDVIVFTRRSSLCDPTRGGTRNKYTQNLISFFPSASSNEHFFRISRFEWWFQFFSSSLPLFIFLYVTIRTFELSLKTSLSSLFSSRFIRLLKIT